MEPEVSLLHLHVPTTCHILSQLDPVLTPIFHLMKIHLKIILPSTPGSPKWLFPSGFPTKTLYTTLLSPIRNTFPVYLILPYFITHTILGKQYRSTNFSLCSFLHSPLTLSLLRPNILFNTLFSKPSSYVHPSIWATNFHTHKKDWQNFSSVHLKFKFLYIRLEDKRLWTEWKQAFLDFNLVLISFWIEFWFVKLLPNIWTVSPL